MREGQGKHDKGPGIEGNGNGLNPVKTRYISSRYIQVLSSIEIWDWNMEEVQTSSVV